MMSLKDNALYHNVIKIAAKKLIAVSRGVESGRNTFISPRAEIGNARRIKLGSDVVIEKYARLIAVGENGDLVIGDNTYVHEYALLKADHGKIRIGRDCTIHDYCVFYGNGNLTIGNAVHIATHTVIVASNHVFADPAKNICEQGLTTKGITIEDDVWIGASAIILDGVTIGKGSVIGAGSVVTKNVEPYSIAVGNPARVIKKRT